MPDERTLNSIQGKAAEGLAILHRLVPAPDHGAGFRRDPEAGFVYYSSEWLSDNQRGYLFQIVEDDPKAQE